MLSFFRRIASALYIPPPKWLVRVVARTIDTEIKELEAERVRELARAEPRPKHLKEIDSGLASLRKDQARFPLDEDAAVGTAA